MNDIISYLDGLGFSLRKNGNGYIATRPLREETVKEISRSNNFYDANVYTENGNVVVEGSPDDIALVASELMDLECHDKGSIESLLSACPYTVDEISDELLLARDTVSEELARLQKSGFVYRIGDFYFHNSFCRRETAERVPMFLLEKYRASYHTAKELRGTGIEQSFIDKTLFYKGIFLRRVFGGHDHEIYN